MLDSGLTQTQLDAYLVPATDGLTVLPLAPGATAADHERAFARMRELASIVVVDCGPGLADPAAQAALAAADQLVVVVEAGAGAREDVATAAAALGDGAPPAVLVVNAIAPRGHDVGWLEHEIPRARGLIAVHSDPRRAAQLRTGELTWSARNGAWDQPLRELAALLSSEWVRLGLAARH
jgi:MinD-like ATPase involved in chromosome partitioning or flagellar assembly